MDLLVAVNDLKSGKSMMLPTSCDTESSYFYYAMLPREEDTRAAYLFRESPVLCQFWGSEMGAGSCMGGVLVRLLSQKAPVDFDWRTSV